MPSATAMRAFTPIFRPCAPVVRSAFVKTPAIHTQQTSAFSTTQSLAERKKGAKKRDTRITAIRYFLRHPVAPRPLRFSRQRHLRHWTIHRAWHLHLNKHRHAAQLDLERQYNSMRDACEALRLMDENGLTVAGGGGGPGNVVGEAGKEVGRLYRTAMTKTDVWNGVPIEYARPQTDFPSREGWNHGWTR